MHNIRLNIFGEQSAVFYILATVVSVIEIAIFYIILKVNGWEDGGLLMLAAVLGGGILAPMICLFAVLAFVILFSIVVLTYVYILDLLNNYKIFKQEYPLEPKELIKSIFPARELGEFPEPDITRKALRIEKKVFCLEFNYENRLITWQILKGAEGYIHVARVLTDHTALPTLLIDSSMNDNATQVFDKNTLAMRTLDLGGDFGNYFTVSTPPGTEQNAYGILTPDFTIELITLIESMDVVMDKTYVEFIFAAPSTASELIYQLDTIKSFLDKLEKNLENKKSTTFLQITHKLHRAPKAIEKIVDSLARNLVKAFLVILVLGAMFVVLSQVMSLTPVIATTAGWLLIPVLVYCVVIVALISHLFSLTFFSKIAILIINFFRSQRRKRHFTHVRRKYSV